MTKKLIMTIGLPGSGKSYWAEKFRLEQHKLGNHFHVVNKDAIREQLSSTGWIWSPKNEADVIKWRDEEIIKCLTVIGCSVISTDTNFGKKHETRLKELAKSYGAEFEIKSFLAVPIEVCIQRDAKREGKARVGEEVIRKMAAQYNLVDTPIIEPYVPNTDLPSAIICDLDGTLAMNQGKRSPYDYSKVGLDEVNLVIRQILNTYFNLKWDIIYVSGRDSSCVEDTYQWLKDHKCPSGNLWMRAAGDKRKDFIVKYEIFDKCIRNYYDVKFVLDDRNQVVDMWRKLGLTCLQVADGNF